MKVKELIEKLKECDGEEEIYYEEDDYSMVFIRSVTRTERNDGDGKKVYKLRLK